MAKRLKNIEKVAQGLGVEFQFMSDFSASFIAIENKTHTICITFDGKGDKFENISIAKKIYQVVDEQIIVKYEHSKHP